jgi:cytochrome c-type biogenesis protein CcsB
MEVRVNAPEAVLFWITTLALAGSLFLAVHAVIFGRPRTFRLAQGFLLTGLLTLTGLGVLRWVRSGHPPFVSLFESMLTGVWFLIVIYLLLRRRSDVGETILAPVAGIGLLLLGWSASLPKNASPLSAALDNVWLFIHASFATAGAATFLIGASFSTIFLLGEERHGRFAGAVGMLPERRALPRSVERTLLFGLVLWGVMLASGSIWAHSAWGRYWAWDPIELWSLISWLLYAALFHARLALRLSQRVFCWLTIAAALTVVFSLWGVHYVYETIHTYG